MHNYKKLYIDKSNYLVYQQYIPKESHKLPTIIFLSGYASDMEGSKALYLEKFCVENSVPYIRFDYFGTGKSSGEFLEGSISIWKENVLKIIEGLTSKDDSVLLIGSSMGSWLMLLIALHYQRTSNINKIHSLIGVSSAPDFTEDLMWDDFNQEQKNKLMEEGQISILTDYCDDPNDKSNHYIVTKKLILDGRQNLLLKNENKIEIECKVTLLHGSCDQDVSYEYSIELAKRLASQNVEIIIKKDAKHRFSEPDDLNLLIKTLKNHIME